jgi:phage baseplate assembly protein W|tara:strand:+ start:740 stop:1141 length:402 start_codon:yes stop_codon:yes gene_type:complete
MPLERVSQGFKDISATFQTNPLNDDLIAIKNETAIARSIRNIVFTLPGEKFFDEDFGSDVSRLLFENLDDITTNLIRDQIFESITNFEPRVRLRNVIAQPNYGNNELNISIVYNIIGIDVPAQQLDFVLQPTR